MEGTGGANVLSICSLGESSLREGAHVTEEKDARVTIDGAAVMYTLKILRQAVRSK
ncbi:MAG TPA: hypothetical protein VJ695_10590 [Nitrososphaera sp.]|nr:hypothetical protein [Nitrososphaera sp.]